MAYIVPDAILSVFAALGAKQLFQYDGPLTDVDPEINDLIHKEKRRQVSENARCALADITSFQWYRHMVGIGGGQ